MTALRPSIIEPTLSPLPAEETVNIGVQLCALSVLYKHLPGVNELMENSMIALSHEFSHLSTFLHQHADSQRALSQQALEEDNPLAATLAQNCTSLEEASHSINSLLIHMQFQDRVSQNLMITIHVIDTIIVHLRRVLESVDVEEKHSFITHLLEQLKLGELQQSFLHKLAEQQHLSPEELNLYPLHEVTCADNIELF